ncbi:hypothetical protein ACTVLL_24760 [Serratia nevei]|uniref:hypothetical protein n=1 Tax=Serratia nevei TaxID=2703794 RepID=UPI003FA74185
MGKALRITLGLRTFTSKKAAVEYFMDQRDAVRAGGELTAGELFEELRELYTRYCDSSPEWALNGRDIIGFVVEHERRRNGATWAQHLCYKVCFPTGKCGRSRSTRRCRPCPGAARHPCRRRRQPMSAKRLAGRQRQEVT